MNQPSTSAYKFDWAAFLLALFFSITSVTMFFISALLVVNGLLGLINSKGQDPSSFMLLAGGTFILGLLQLPGLFLNLRYLFNMPVSLPNFQFTNNILFGIFISLLWLLILIFGWFTRKNLYTSTFILPIINIFAVFFPALFFIALSLYQIKLPPAREAWSVLGTTIIIAPFLAFVLELISVLAVVIIFSLLSPSLSSLQESLKILIKLLNSGSGSYNEINQIIARLFISPGVAPVTFLIFSVMVPIIEEIAKTIMIWPLLPHLRQPAYGFVFGILCGAGFALTENFGFMSSGSADWVSNALIRASSTIPHIFNTGLFGWALASTWQDKNIVRLLSAFVAVVLIHGLWNALGLGLVINELYSYNSNVPRIFQQTYPFVTTWVFLGLGALWGLIYYNHKIRISVKHE